MKAIYALIVMTLLLNFTACTTSEEEMVIENSTFESVMKTYGLEVASATPAHENVPSVAMEEMVGVLEALRQNSGVSRVCVVESQKIKMTGEYSAATRSGSSLENFALSVELNFNIDNGQVHYLGTDYFYSSDLFEWRANGLSLASNKNLGKYTYEFESQSYLYFKVQDQSDSLVRVSVVFKGNYDFQTEKGTYSFRLAKG